VLLSVVKQHILLQQLLTFYSTVNVFFLLKENYLIKSVMYIFIIKWFTHIEISEHGLPRVQKCYLSKGLSP